MNIRVELATILTTTLDMDQATLDLSIAPAANAGIFSGHGVANFDQFMVAREELIGLTRKAKAASVVESFILDQWKTEPVDGVDAIDGVDEVIDPISGSVLVGGVEAIEGIEPVIGEFTSFRSAMIDMEDVINDELLTNIHVDDAADISFKIEFYLRQRNRKAIYSTPSPII